MILWTIQTKKFWDNAQGKSILKADRRYVWKAFKRPYAWMHEQMCERICPSDNGILWAWYQYISEDKRKPWLSKSGHLKTGTEGVLIEFDVSKNEVLLSDFENWHFPLNNWYLGDCRKMDRLLDAYPDKNYPDDVQMHIEDSWNRIFKTRKNEPTQATLWSVDVSKIRAVTEFIAR